MEVCNDKGKIIVISGASGTGKGTIIKSLASKIEFSFSVSHTTRQIRPGETDGIDYHYVSVKEFAELEKMGKMVETTVYSGNHYGTSYKAIEDVINTGKNIVLDIEVEGGGNIKKKFSQAIEIFILPPSLQELENRLRGRASGESENVIQTRLNRAREELAISLGIYDYFVINDKVDKAVEEVCNLINKCPDSNKSQGAIWVKELLKGNSVA